MLIDDIEAFIEKYIKINSLLDDIAKDDGGRMLFPPRIVVSSLHHDIDLYNREYNRDPYSALVDINLICNESFEVEDLLQFNIMNIGFWKDSNANVLLSTRPILYEVFSIDSNEFKKCISYETFLACCIALNEMKNFTNLIIRCDFTYSHKYVMDVFSRIASVDPFFLVKLFFKDTKKFIECINYSHDLSLPTTIVKSFISNIPLDKSMFRTAISLFKQEMATKKYSQFNHQ